LHQRSGTAFPCQWHHREQISSTCRGRQNWRLPFRGYLSVEGEREWRRAAMAHPRDDGWFGRFVPEQTGRYTYAIEA
jgi:hypothetical protein